MREQKVENENKNIFKAIQTGKGERNGGGGVGNCLRNMEKK